VLRADQGRLIVGGSTRGALRVEEKRSPTTTLQPDRSVADRREAKDVIMMFMTDAALKQFQAAKAGVGVDANVASSTSAAASGGPHQDERSIIAFVFDVKA